MIRRDAQSDGPLGVFLIGVNGSVATATTAGTFAVQRGLVSRNGLVSELAELKPLDLVPLSDLRFFGWDLREESHSVAVERNSLVAATILNAIRNDIAAVEVFRAPLTGVSDHIARVAGVVSSSPRMSRRDVSDRVVADIREASARHRLRGAVVINVASTEPPPTSSRAHNSLAEFEAALDSDDPSISPGMLYAYAALRAGAPYVNFTPTVAADIDAIIELANQERLPIAGKDAKTGQTLYKTVLAPMFRWRNLRVDGWYSTNLLGNDDGYVLSDPRHAATKIASKTGSLVEILGYGDFPHQVHIHFHSPHGEGKEAWDVVHFRGWLDTVMSVRVNWLGQDSALAAPLVIDLARLIWLAAQRGESGPVAQLGAFFKSPIGASCASFAEQTQELLRYCSRHEQS